MKIVLDQANVASNKYNEINTNIWKRQCYLPSLPYGLRGNGCEMTVITKVEWVMKQKKILKTPIISLSSKVNAINIINLCVCHAALC